MERNEGRPFVVGYVGDALGSEVVVAQPKRF
jgi:hypothetical protein